MAFEGLSSRLQDIFKKIRGKGKISEEDIKAAMREVRLALLEADVNFKVVKSFEAKISERAVGQEVMQSITPGQQVVKIVHDELKELMGGEGAKLINSSKSPNIYMAVGLQGAGKTTSVAKLGKNLLKQGRQPLLVACDIYRPAAIKQLQVLGEQTGVPVFAIFDADPVTIAEKAIQFARAENRDAVILDTAGRLHVNEELMRELKDIKTAIDPDEILLVVDAMTGQDAVNVAEGFHNDLGLTGVILTKLDGDARGGAALSVKAVTGCPIKFIGVGEKLDALEVFYPERMASRILGMGDIITLVERAQANIDEETARKMGRKIRQQDFTLNDFLEQMQQVRSMGPLKELLGMVPGLGKHIKGTEVDFEEKDIKRVEAVILSMTFAERDNPAIINGSRKKRIATGSGVKVQEVNRLLKQFEESKKMMKQFADLGNKKGKRAGVPPMQFPFN